MVLTNELKIQIAQAIKVDYDLKGAKAKNYSQSRHAKFLKITPSVHSRLLNGDIERVLSEDNWLRIGSKLGVDLTGQNWRLAKTVTFSTINAQLDHCKSEGIARFFSDLVGLGKTTAAMHFTQRNVNAVYVNCKKYQTRQPLIRAIAEEFGFESKGNFIAVRENLINQIRVLDTPIVTLDDAGYLRDDALLEVIAMWDDLEHLCGWYFIGEPAFKDRIDKMILKDKLGWEAWFSRFGDRVLQITDELNGEGEVATMRRVQATQILKANYPDANAETVKELLASSKCSLRALRNDISKHKRGLPL